MIPKSFIQEWAKTVPWQEPRQVEHDLILTNVLLKIYSHPKVKDRLAFRGGTALNKLFFVPPTRYSEDIDLVQTKEGPIGPIIDALREVLDVWLGEPKRLFTDGLVTLVYRTVSEEGFPLRIKVEINSREHFSVLGFHNFQFRSSSSWTSGNVQIYSYKLEELLGTKMRALYQRRKGRDLYDLHVALTTIPQLDRKAILHCFSKYIEFAGHRISRKAFLENMDLKLKNKEFLEDMMPLLPKNIGRFDPEKAYQNVRENLIKHLD